MVTLTQAQVLDGFWPAYKRLPESYQNDSCLQFFVTDCVLYCEPKESDRVALGTWLAFYDNKRNAWVDAVTLEPYIQWEDYDLYRITHCE